jgi:hypothetical protein
MARLLSQRVTWKEIQCIANQQCHFSNSFWTALINMIVQLVNSVCLDNLDPAPSEKKHVMFIVPVYCNRTAQTNLRNAVVYVVRLVSEHA